MRINVAGVTFNNEAIDGGKSRQSILAELYATKNIITVDLKTTTYNGEKAIKVVEHSTKQCIGWIPKTKVHRLRIRVSKTQEQGSTPYTSVSFCFCVLAKS